VTVPLAIVLLSAGPRLLGLFGSEFADGYPALSVLVIGHAIGALAGPIGFLVIMTGNQREGAWILGSAAVLNMVMNYFLIPRFGLLGGASATAITTVAWNATMLAFVGRKLRVNPTIISVLFGRPPSVPQTGELVNP
jgi:O-antigen/teichoic acid export membrane protein